MFQLYASTKSKLLSASWGLSLILAVTTQSLRADIIIDGFTANTNDRFTNNPAFIGTGLNFSGVGQVSASVNVLQVNRWATAISRNVVISAGHWQPGGTVNFYATNDSSSLVTRSIVSGIQIFGTDLYLGVLDSDLPASITHYNYATQALSGGFLTSAGIYQNMNAYLFGISPVAQPVGQDQAVGRNRISGYWENSGFDGNTDADLIALLYEPNSNPNYVQYETFLQGGDSGAPMFVDMGGGNLVLLGINSTIVLTQPGVPIPFSGISYTGNRATDITNFINSVPEPSTLLVVALGQLGLMLRRRRKTV